MQINVFLDIITFFGYNRIVKDIWLEIKGHAMLNGKRAIKTIMADKKIKSGFIADNLEMDRQAFYNWLNREKGMNLDKMNQVAEILGCDIVIRDKATGKIYE